MTQVTAKLTTGMAVQLSNGRHEWKADEPPEAGGADTGPNPYELLLGSLAACTCITIAGYCQFKKLPLESISTTYDFSRIHADDCKDCDMPDRGFIEKVTSSMSSPSQPAKCHTSGSASTSPDPTTTMGIAMKMPIRASPVIRPAENNVPF